MLTTDATTFRLQHLHDRFADLLSILQRLGTGVAPRKASKKPPTSVAFTTWIHAIMRAEPLTAVADHLANQTPGRRDIRAQPREMQARSHLLLRRGLDAF